MTRPLNFVMISPHFPTNFEPFAHRLKANGMTVLGIADAPYESLSEGLRSALTEYYRVDDMEDYDQMYRAVAYFAHKYGKIDRIESHNEHWLEMDARLRTDFNVFGFKNEDMKRIKTKSQMKEIFRQQGIAVARGRVIGDREDTLKLIAEVGYPVVAKPDRGVGASDTYKIHNAAELEDFFAKRNPDVPYIMEEFIAGDIVTFDGLTDQDGNLVFYSSLAHNHTLLDVVTNDNDMHFVISREIPEVLKELGQKCVTAFGIKERFFHFEFFRLAEDDYIALEINCRPPGGLAIDMFNYANDFDIFAEYAYVVKENRFYATLTRPYHCIYFSRKSSKNYVHSHEEVLTAFPEHFVQAQHIPGVFSAIMGDMGYVFKASDWSTMQEIMAYVEAKHEEGK